MSILHLYLGIFLAVFNAEDLPGIKTNDLPGLEIESSSVFNGSALWGYINGGADLYLEYGFDRVHAQKILFKGKHYNVDVYKMEDAASAFGIFSVSHYDCDKNPWPVSCKTNYQVQVVRGPYYISIVNETGSEEEQEVCLKFADLLLNQCEESAFEIPEVFKSKTLLPFSNRLKFMKGNLGVQNGYPRWSQYFEDLESFWLYVVPVSNKDIQVILAGIPVESLEDVNIMIQRFGFEQSQTEIIDPNIHNTGIFSTDRKKGLLIRSNFILFFESDTEEALQENVFDILE